MTRVYVPTRYVDEAKLVAALACKYRGPQQLRDKNEVIRIALKIGLDKLSSAGIADMERSYHARNLNMRPVDDSPPDPSDDNHQP
jgi:hypothetical protein